MSFDGLREKFVECTERLFLYKRMFFSGICFSSGRWEMGLNLFAGKRVEMPVFSA